MERRFEVGIPKATHSIFGMDIVEYTQPGGSIMFMFDQRRPCGGFVRFIGNRVVESEFGELRKCEIEQ